MNSNIRKAAIYCKGNDLAYQAGIAATFIIDRGLSFSGLYLENDSLNILAQACARGYVDAIIVKNINVLTDDIEALTVFEEQLPVPIICVEDLYCTKENLDFETLEYKESVKHKTAQHKEYLSKSLSDILREKKENGDILGVVPFGYLKENGKLIPDPKTASCVRKIFTKAKDGEKITAIARWLEQEGILTSRGSLRWSDNTIRDMLKNDVYVNGIIDKYLFDAVQERFKEKTELDKIVQRTQGEYRGLVFCEACNRAMCYQGIDKKTYRKTAFYSCKHHTGVHPKGKPLAHMPKIGEEVLKAEVLKQFNEYILNITSDKNKLNEAVNRFGEKKNALEQDIEAVGKKILQTRELPEGRAGLWTSWKDARDGYLVSLFYRYFILCQYGMYQIQRMINKHDYLENRFIKSITVSPKGTVSVHFLGDFLFE